MYTYSWYIHIFKICYFYTKIWTEFNISQKKEMQIKKYILKRFESKHDTRIVSHVLVNYYVLHCVKTAFKFNKIFSDVDKVLVAFSGVRRIICSLHIRKFIKNSLYWKFQIEFIAWNIINIQNSFFKKQTFIKAEDKIFFRTSFVSRK